MKNLICVFLILIIGNHALMANISYFYMDRCYERSYAEGMEMMAEIHEMQDAHDVDKIEFVGTRVNEVPYNANNAAAGTMLHALGEYPHFEWTVGNFSSYRSRTYNAIFAKHFRAGFGTCIP